MGSAQLDFIAGEDTTASTSEPRPSALRQQVVERLAAHRQRKERHSTAEPEGTPVQANKLTTQKNRIAAAVAERYAHTPSYRAVLADEARRAIHEATAAAQVAQRNAEAVAAAQQELLGELELWNAPQNFTADTAITIDKAANKPDPKPDPKPALEQRPEPMTESKSARVPAERPAGLTVRLYEDLRPIPPVVPTVSLPAGPDIHEAIALDAEIDFRQAPVWEEFEVGSEHNVPLPANLLEFPRQLVAARKARPRLAEGPLRDELTAHTAQLRIFEVEPGQISTAPALPPVAPEWTTSIHLDAHTVTQPVPTLDAPVLVSVLPPQTAPLQLRVMSAMVDGIFVSAAALAFIAAYAHAGGVIPLGVPAALSILGILIVIHVLYQLLFFTFSDETPGMRYARIGLCTFSDENPTRKDMRRRIFAQFVAICPLGLGILWILLDDDALGWHDRISRMYQRTY